MNSIGEARQQIADALAPLLAGRVHAYRPPTVSAPAIWIDAWTLNVVSDVSVVTFIVLGIVDGADHAQLAAIDEMGARAWDAVRPSRPKARSARTRDVLIDGKTYRGFELFVDAAIRANTLCVPTVEPIQIPVTQFVEV